jgi:hypothetical protein
LFAEGDAAPSNGPAPDGENGGKPAETDPPRTYGDDDVNRMKLNWQRDLLKQLGAGDDIKTAKDGVKRYQDWIASQKSDLEKAQGDVTTLTGNLDAEKAKSLRLERQVLALGKGVPAERVGAYVSLAEGCLGEDGDFGKALDAALKDFPLPQQAPKRGSAGTGANPPPDGKGGPELLGAKLARLERERAERYQKKEA